MSPQTTTAPTPAVATARRLAEELLAPHAAAVEAAGAVPRSHLEALAQAGLRAVDGDDALAVVEELAAGDLATAFVWIQQVGVARWLEAGSAADGRWATQLDDLRAGRTHAGIALQAALRPGPAAVVARRLTQDDDGDGWVLDGAVPWVTGWGLLDALLLTARDGEEVLFLLLDLRTVRDGDGDIPRLRAEALPLAAVRASRTVQLHLDGVHVGAGQLVARAQHAALLAGDAAGLRPNGSLALGLVLRCVRALGDGGGTAQHVERATALAAELDAVRQQLDAAGPAELPAARAAAVDLAWRAAATLSLTTGSSAVISGSLAERTVREALFLLVFGSRPAIREALLDGLLPGAH
ncbi:Acyl-CoA dehydrogenase [Quadrisphaera granulorum]|uniref:Alkylation response protein AidB-like acyl-CoA dehydrogenase n=1 Tax=Quadrisphaera granulorum TaxID=317664 RepID=A0A316A947_9ACTN|nr:acyl-CoA dehydrogenase [Quadrisphaera granulorum]PWJ46317.1 alkylation response protein AidB-like acyl-CoA dehydrogenase [Quadrisphaera granulorum]SZE99078.1 Acyl-CoA dehydrogenase [Quadrisphaera granulorum]